MKKLEKINNHEFILEYLDKEKDDNLKNLISASLDKKFLVKKA